MKYPIWQMLVFLALTGATTACSPSCSESVQETFKAAFEGDLIHMKAYFAEGGDPMLSCTDYSGKGFWPDRYLGHGVQELHTYVSWSRSKELMALYLEQDVPGWVKDDLLLISLVMEDMPIAELLLKQGAHLNSLAQPDGGLLGEPAFPVMERALTLGYDFNWQDPKDQGNTLLMKYCLRDLSHHKPAALELLEGGLSDDDEYFVKLAKDEDAREQAMVLTLKKLLGYGADVAIQNKNGQTASDLCVSETVRTFLLDYQGK